VSNLYRAEKVQSIDASPPTIRKWSKSITALVPDGCSIVLKEMLASPLFLSSTPDPVRTRETPRPILLPKTGRGGGVLRKMELLLPEVNFKDSSLEEVLEFLSRECDLNIVPLTCTAGEPGPWPREAPQPTENKRNTLRLKNVPLKDVLRYVLKYWNLKFVEEEYAILVVPQDYIPDKRPVHDPGGSRTLITIITAKIVRPE
jgi:hypothetical protein